MEQTTMPSFRAICALHGEKFHAKITFACQLHGPGSLFETVKIRNGLFLNGYNSNQGNFGTVVIWNGENSEKTVRNNE